MSCDAKDDDPVGCLRAAIERANQNVDSIPPPLVADCLSDAELKKLVDGLIPGCFLPRRGRSSVRLCAFPEATSPAR